MREAGSDPLAERKHDKLVAAFKAANSFGDIAKEYINKMVAEGRANTTITKANWPLEQLAPIAARPVADLKPLDVLASLKRLEPKGKYEAARRCRSFASRIFRYAVATGCGETDPTSLLRGAMIVPKVTHHAAILEPQQVGDLPCAIDTYSGHHVTRLAMQIAPHVMARPGELRLAKWSEFNLDGAVWKIPAERMKMRRPHEVPLSCQVMDYLEELWPLTGSDGFVFPAFHTSLRPLSENTLNQAFRRMGYARGEVIPHGLRTTASTLLNESGKWSPDAIERSLAHADTNSIRGIYNRGRYWDERVAMHQWWSEYLDQLRDAAGQRASDKRVIAAPTPLRSAARRYCSIFLADASGEALSCDELFQALDANTREIRVYLNHVDFAAGDQFHQLCAPDCKHARCVIDFHQ